MIEKETFENLLREVLPYVSDIKERLQQNNAVENMYITVGKDGYICISMGDVEYTRCKNDIGRITRPFPLEL